MSNAYQEHLDRVMAAVNFEPVDRVPYVPCATLSNAFICGVSPADYCADMALNTETNLKGYLMCGEPDGVQSPIYCPDILPIAWLSKVLVPGRELAPDVQWQVDETGVLTQDDYDQIISKGYDAWIADVYMNRLDNPLSRLGGFFAYVPEANRIFAEAGIPNFCGMTLSGPVETICGGRTLIPFMADDLYDIPEKVEQAFEIIHEANMKNWEAAFNSPAKPVGVWIGGWRGTPDLLNRDMFLKYSWKYMLDMIQLCIDYGVVPTLHLDSNWDNAMDLILKLPPHKVIVSLDGMTDIFKAGEILEGHSCIMGDVPSIMTSYASVEEIDAYCERLIREVGPRGYILATGCDTPPNAKLENLQAMGAAPKKYAHLMK